MGCPWRRGKRCASVRMCRWMVFTHISDGAIYVLGMLCAFIKLLYIIMSSLSWVSIIYTHIHLCRCGSATYAPRGIFPATSCSLTSRPVATPCTARTRRVLSTAAKARADDAGEEWAIVMVISRRSSKPQAYRHHTPKGTQARARTHNDAQECRAMGSDRRAKDSIMPGCWQMLAPPHSLHVLLCRRRWQTKKRNLSATSTADTCDVM